MANTHVETKNNFGFWIYIMSDCMLFAALFATYAVLQNNIHMGPSGKELFSLPFVMIETLILLTSSFTFGLGILESKKGNKKKTLTLFAITMMLGVAFLCMEIYEFCELIHEGATPSSSAFLSAFFTLVGTHGLHVFGGLIWMLLLFIQIIIHGINGQTQTKIFSLGLFWHFLDVVWIFVFTIVYLIGTI